MNYNKLLKNLKIEDIDTILSSISEIQFIDTKYRGSYFWRPGSYYQRRRNETSGEITFSINDNIFLYRYNYQESCKHCYFSKSIYCNDECITMRTINTLEKKLRELKDLN